MARPAELDSNAVVAKSRVRLLGPRIAVGTNTRVAWAGVALACLAVLGVAAVLTPDPRGHGTHEGLGKLFGTRAMPPCSWPLITGLPCPTCGMTTSFSNVVRGRLVTAFVAQPAGMVLCLATIGMLFYSLYVALTGWKIWVHWDRVSVRLMLGLGLLIMGGWAFKLAYGLLNGSLPAN
ncbi:MAG: DUF2752 domain-containing protein [Phycisphaerales bacterium]|nr:DUF2752 domain-containing protein [Phycisphaerales bacterium]